MDTLTDHILTSREDLAARFDPPTERLATKALDHVNAAGRRFIAQSPFLVLATCGADGLDCSPKGDAPGFVTVSEDGKTLLIPDRVGNNRIDGLKNLVEDARVATIFFIPGANETFRVNGRARISADPELRGRFVVKGKEPKVVLVISVEQAFQHCPKALLRSNLWQAAQRGRPADAPTLGDFSVARGVESDKQAVDGWYYSRVMDELY
ncbi:MAG TPA: MSMEG_1061 family FMN-dependent PPOX-type flavoprotein [Stellaceae bacterium]|jgi:PPOX class probable FMN-dependent enzyme|nr:MSMEG_1061 family FMN-dependent PPOX-type flavoprotein [Stellaceae bacterium]